VIAGLVAGGLALVLYLCTAHRTVDCDDVAEFQTLAATGGIAHSGYPVPVMLLQLLGHLPLSTMAFRARLLSVVGGALAVGLAGYTGAKVSSRRAAGVVAALALAMAITMWEESTQAEVYAIALAFAATIFLVAVRFAARPDTRGGLALGLLGGAGLFSHYTTLGLLPVVAGTTIQAAKSGRLRARHVAVGVAGLLIGLSPFLYMLGQDRPDQPMNYIHDTLRPENIRELSGAHPPVTRLERSIWLLSARQYLASYGYAPFGSMPRKTLSLALTIVMNEFPIWGLPLAALGFWEMVRQRSRWWPHLALWMAGILFWMLYAAFLWVARMFFLPGLWVLSVGIAAALGALGRRSQTGFIAISILLLITPIVRLAIAEPPGPIRRFTLTRMTWDVAPAEWSPFSPDTSWDAYGRGIMRTLPPRAVVLACWQEATTLRYFRYAEPLRDDVDILYNCRVPAPTFAAADAAARPIFTTYEPTLEMTGGRPFHLVGRWNRGGLWRIQ
jgi:4-amino-4-deoxy-L-arabinose transferase-like glycosyltransferase